MAEADPRKTFNLNEAKTRFSRLVDRAHAGEEIIVAKAGVPYAKLVSIEPVAKRKRRPGGWPELDHFNVGLVGAACGRGSGVYRRLTR